MFQANVINYLFEVINCVRWFVLAVVYNKNKKKNVLYIFMNIYKTTNIYIIERSFEFNSITVEVAFREDFL